MDLNALNAAKEILTRYGDHQGLTVRPDGLYTGLNVQPGAMDQSDVQRLAELGFVFDIDQMTWKAVPSQKANPVKGDQTLPGPESFSAAQREADFRADLAALLARHGAEIEVTDDGRPHGMQSGVCLVTMNGTYLDGEPIKAYTEFNL